MKMNNKKDAVIRWIVCLYCKWRTEYETISDGTWICWQNPMLICQQRKHRFSYVAKNFFYFYYFFRFVAPLLLLLPLSPFSYFPLLHSYLHYINHHGTGVWLWISRPEFDNGSECNSRCFGRYCWALCYVPCRQYQGKHILNYWLFHETLFLTSEVASLDAKASPETSCSFG